MSASRKPVPATGFAAISFILLAFAILLNSPATAAEAAPEKSKTRAESSFQVRLQQRLPQRDGLHQLVQSDETWVARETAVIVCDMWDAHHCLNATRRGGELAPRINAFLKAARENGALVIHAPSSCMEFYKDHPARRRAIAAPKAGNLPKDIDQWLHWIDEAEKKAGYPIDHSDGGEDDDPVEHKEWALKLEKEMGRNPRSPWIRQAPDIEIDGERDAITDSGVENWNLLEQRGVKNVMIVGVHTNMCVLGRPFGLRQLARNGKNVVLVRDLTDTMYNPKQRPQVNHFAGTDLIVSHVEKYVCPTIVSPQILKGSEPLKYKKDTRPHLVIILAEKEYETNRTVPAFADKHLAPDFRITYATAPPEEGRDNIPGMAALKTADVALVSVRRRTPAAKDMKALRDFIAAGKPVVGIRTSSHAFSIKGKTPPEGHASWEKFDPEVWGGNYQGHHGNKFATKAWVEKSAADHPLVKAAQLNTNPFPTGGSLYQVLPLEKGTTVLLSGSAEGIAEHQPVAWTFRTKSGGKTFCTSLGQIKDFDQPAFTHLLKQAIHWAVVK